MQTDTDTEMDYEGHSINGPFSLVIEDRREDGCLVVDADGTPVARTIDIAHAEREESIAALLAAAPNTLDALKAAYAYLVSRVPPGGVRKAFHEMSEHAALCRTLHDAIELAEGTRTVDPVGPCGRCDTCGAACDHDGCTANRSHAIA